MKFFILYLPTWKLATEFSVLFTDDFNMQNKWDAIVHILPESIFK